MEVLLEAKIILESAIAVICKLHNIYLYYSCLFILPYRIIIVFPKIVKERFGYIVINSNTFRRFHNSSNNKILLLSVSNRVYNLSFRRKEAEGCEPVTPPPPSPLDCEDPNAEGCTPLPEQDEEEGDGDVEEEAEEEDGANEEVEEVEESESESEESSNDEEESSSSESEDEESGSEEE